MRNAEKLAATPPVTRLAFGTLDFQVDLDIAGDDDALLAFRSHLVLVSRLAGVPAPIDGVTTSIDDLELLRADTRRSRRLGFGAKLSSTRVRSKKYIACSRPPTKSALGPSES